MNESTESPLAIHEKKSQGKLAVVTGAAMGIGWGIAQALSRGGVGVLLVDQSETVFERAEALSLSSGQVHAKRVDLSNLDQIHRLISDINTEYNRCDILVNNAGIHNKNGGEKYALAEISLENWTTTFAINLTAPFVLSQGLLPLMKKRNWGRVINISSRAGRTYVPTAGAHYSASKAGLIGLTRVIAGEYGPYGVTANCIAPGRVLTPLALRSSSLVQQEALKQFLIGRIGT